LGLGNSIWASSLVLESFMGGLGIGNGLVGRYGDGLRHPLRLYAMLELGIAVSGFGLVVLLPVITPVLVPVFRPFLNAAWSLNGLRGEDDEKLLLMAAEPAAHRGYSLGLQDR
jgi:hypothetical protein